MGRLRRHGFFFFSIPPEVTSEQLREIVPLMPNIVFVTILVVIVMWFLLSQTQFGQHIYAIGNNIGGLYGAGARKFLVWSAPDLGLTPAICTLDSISPGAKQAAEFLSQSYNSGLDAVLGSLAGLPGIEITRLDVNQKLNELITNPGAFGLKVVAAACVTPNSPPYECQTPDEFLFWDGIHPTKAVHAILAQEAALVSAH